METVGRVVGLVLVLGLLCVSCGSNGNDQGSSFRAVGIFQGTVEQNRCTVPVADKAIADPGIALQLSSPQVDDGFPNSFSIFICRAFIELENNLEGQAFVVDRIDFEYEIPGAHIAIPSSSMPTGIRINPADADPDKNPSPFGQVNVVFAQPDGQLIPSTVVAFLRQNQPSLPALPYNMIIHITARGRTDSGDLLVSNEIRYAVQWTPS